MALLFMDSFDHYATADLPTKWTTAAGTFGNTVTIASSNGRRASGSLRFFNATGLSNATYYAQKTLAPVDPTTAIVGVAVSVPANLIGGAGFPLLSLRDGGTAQVTLRVNADLTLSAVRGAHNGTVLGSTGAAVLSLGTYAYLELKVLIHPSAGTVDVRVNGASVLSLSSQNTRNSAASQWTSVVLGCLDSVGGTELTTTSSNLDMDDCYILDGSGSAPLNTFLGDVRVDARYPTAAGATTVWTPSTGANWQNVDDAAPNGDTDYNASSTVGATDTFTTQDAPVTGATIYGVQHCLNLKKMDSGICTVAPVIRHSGVNYPGADLSPATVYAFGLQIAAVNPGTGAAWTEAGFNAAEFGYKRTA